MGSRVLITNYCLNEFDGTQLYVRDLALELRRLGHIPAVYASWLGKVSEELSAAGIPVTNSLKRLDFVPDIIHGHHRFETLSAVVRFPNTPALYICHDHNHWADVAPLHSHILRYYGVSRLCVRRLRDSGVPDHKIGQIYNFVDLQRFKPRSPLPAQPARALVFSNYAANETYVPAIAEACRQAGLELAVVGKGVGNPVARPEEILGRYDIVFAKAKAAMEAMAVGLAVVLCDYGGVGPMVTSENFSRLRPLNFGFQALTEPHTPENVLRQIARYDARDAESVRDELRACAGLEHAAAELVEIYRQVIAEHHSRRPVYGGTSDISCYATMARYLLAYRAKRLWKSLSYENRQAIGNLRGFDALQRGIRCLFYGRMK